MEKTFARIILILCHPLLISTIGVLLLFRSNLYIAFISEQMRQIVILTTFASTCLMPLIFIVLTGVASRYVEEHGSGRKVTAIYLFTAICYYIGYYFLSKIPLAGFFKAGFLAGILVLISLSLISMRWNISAHTAGIGALAGVSVAMMLRIGGFDPIFLSAVLIAGGLTGYSSLLLEKNNPAQVYAGYILGFGMLFVVFTYI